MPPGATSRLLVGHELNFLLADDADRPEGPNIGARGEHLTISFLSLNRTSLSQRLCRSIAQNIPGFSGEVLAIDNGSAPEEIAELRGFLEGMPYRWRIVELGRNCGVAAGRNRAAEHVSTRWLMCLDNDIYFIANPIPRIQSDLAELGCRFMSLPLLEGDGKQLFAKGGLLYVTVDESGAVMVGGGSAVGQGPVESYHGPGFFGLFLFGGASVVDVESFRAIGGYDECCFVGFEDTDLSIRLFRAGQKVGATGAVALIHDHPAPTKDIDAAYERDRFSGQSIYQSALYLEAKHGFKFWHTGITGWLNERQTSLGIAPGERIPDVVPAAVRHKTKIALVTDTDDWAFANIVRQVMRTLGDTYAFSFLPCSSLGHDYVRLMLLLRGHDLTHFFWRNDVMNVTSERTRRQLQQISQDFDEVYADCVGRQAVTTAVYDHLFLSPEQIEGWTPLFRSLTGYSVASKRLYDIYSAIAGYPPPAAILTDGVDLDLFRPMNNSRWHNINERPLVVGWAGNSAWSADLEDFKGVATICAPPSLRSPRRALVWRATSPTGKSALSHTTRCPNIIRRLTSMFAPRR